MKFINSIVLGQVPLEESAIVPDINIDYFPAMINEINLYYNLLLDMFSDFKYISFTINAEKNSNGFLIYVVKLNYNDEYLSLVQTNFIINHLPKKWNNNTIYDCTSKYYINYIYQNSIKKELL